MHTHQSPHAHTHVKKESISLHVLSTLQGLDMVIYLIILKNWNTDYWAVSCGSLANANTASGLFISKTWTVLFPKPSFSKLLTVPDFRMKSWGSVNWKKYVCKQLLIVGQSGGGEDEPWSLICNCGSVLRGVQPSEPAVMQKMLWYGDHGLHVCYHQHHQQQEQGHQISQCRLNV